MKADELRTLSNLLDEAMDLPLEDQDAWLMSLQGEALRLAPTLRELLSMHASPETADLIDRPPPFTASDEHSVRPSDFNAGASIGPYRLLRELGHGGMGEVWLAERVDGHLKREVALKLPLLHARRGVLVQRFARERDILASLTHPHIARLYDAGLAEDGQPYLALEFVEGLPITEYCTEQGLDIQSRVRLFQQVLKAVQYAHAHLVIHRDLKPSNVLVNAEGHAMLLDFGIAKLLQLEDQHAAETELTRAGGRALTLHHAAPEQIGGTAISTATDVWALGVLLYQLIADQLPFRQETRGALEQAILTQDPPRPSAVRKARRPSADLDTIAMKALKKQPAERYASVNAFAEDLDRWLDGEPVRAQPDSAWYRGRRFVARNRLGVAAGFAAALALLSTTSVAVWQALEARDQARRAQQNADAAQSEARRAQAVQDFVLDIFRANSREQSDPIKAQATTARELLDVGAARVEFALKDAPDSRLQVLATLAEMYVQIGLRDRAMALERLRMDLARTALGPHDTRRATTALALSQHLYDSGHREEAHALLQEARGVLDAAGDSDSRVRGELFLRQANFLRYESLHGAQANADAALGLFTHQDASGLMLIRAHHLAGRVHLGVFDLEKAQAFLSAAHALTLRSGPEASAGLILIAGDLAEVQQSVGKFADAEKTLRDAIAGADRTHGADSGVALMLRIGLVDLLLRTGRTTEGLALQHDTTDAIKRTRQPLDAHWRRNAEALQTRFLFDFGQLEQALPGLRAAVELLARELPRSVAYVERRRQLAEVLTALGRLDEVENLLDDATAGWERYTAGMNQPWMNGHLLLARGRLRLAQGRASDAIALLQQIVPSRIPAEAAVDAQWMRRNVALSDAWFANGEPYRAADAAQSVIAALDRIEPPYRLPHIESSAWLALGRVQLHLGDLATARTSLERAVALRRNHDAQDSFWLAQAQQVLARCMLEQGEVSAAHRLLIHAQGAARAVGVKRTSP